MEARNWLKSVPKSELLRKVTLVNGEDVASSLENSASKDRRLCLKVHTLTFSIPPSDQTLPAPAIPHSAIRIDLGDVVKMVIPGYKPKSYSVSELRKDEFDVTFKVYPNGRASGYLDRLKIGDMIQSFGKSANRLRNPGKYVGIIAFGVGITEALPIVKMELEKKDASTVVLLWACRTYDDYFWTKEIEHLLAEYSGTFRLYRILSRDTKEGCLHGRVGPDILQQVFEPNPKENARFLSVGTKEMMNMTYEALEQIGYSMPENALLPKRNEIQ